MLTYKTCNSQNECKLYVGISCKYGLQSLYWLISIFVDFTGNLTPNKSGPKTCKANSCFKQQLAGLLKRHLFVLSFSPHFVTSTATVFLCSKQAEFENNDLHKLEDLLVLVIFLVERGSSPPYVHAVVGSDTNSILYCSTDYSSWLPDSLAFYLTMVRKSA